MLPTINNNKLYASQRSGLNKFAALSISKCSGLTLFQKML